MNECDKMIDIKDKSLLLSEFVDWLGQEGMSICNITDNDYQLYEPMRGTFDELFARFFSIDLNKVEKEKQNLLKALRHTHRMIDEKDKNG